MMYSIQTARVYVLCMNAHVNKVNATDWINVLNLEVVGTAAALNGERNIVGRLDGATAQGKRKQ